MGDTDDSLLGQSSTYSIANGTFNRNANVTIGSVAWEDARFKVYEDEER